MTILVKPERKESITLLKQGTLIVPSFVKRALLHKYQFSATFGATAPKCKSANWDKPFQFRRNKS